MEKEYSEKKYSLIAIDKLTIVSVYNLFNQSEECAFERLVKECFILFPKRFCLRRYEQWPDSNRVYLSMIRCRNNGWIKGNEKNGFKITEFGIKTAKEIISQLSSAKVDITKKDRIKHSRERGEAIINFLKQSKAFENFKTNKDIFNITESELKEMLGATKETPERVIKQNFEYCLNICKEYNEKELVNFLIECKNKHFINY